MYFNINLLCKFLSVVCLQYLLLPAIHINCDNKVANTDVKLENFRLETSAVIMNDVLKTRSIIVSQIIICFVFVNWTKKHHLK